MKISRLLGLSLVIVGLFVSTHAKVREIERRRVVVVEKSAEEKAADSIKATLNTKEIAGTKMDLYSTGRISDYFDKARTTINADNAEEKILEATALIEARGISNELARGRTVHDTFLFVNKAAELDSKIPTEKMGGYDAAMKSLLTTVAKNTLRPPKNEGGPVDGGGSPLEKAIENTGAFYGGDKDADASTLKGLYADYGLRTDVIVASGKCFYAAEINAERLGDLVNDGIKFMKTKPLAPAYIANVGNTSKATEMRGISYNSSPKTSHWLYDYVMEAEKVIKTLSTDKTSPEYKAFIRLLTATKNNKLQPANKIGDAARTDGLSLPDSIKKYSAIEWGIFATPKDTAIKNINDLYTKYGI